MELLVVTLVHTNATRDTETAARIHMIADTIRPAPGLISIHSYQSRGEEGSYALLSTWDDEESWHKAQERHNPRQLLLNSTMKGQIVGEPEQWFLHYLWGYTRPGITPVVMTLQLATIRPERIEQAQQLWLNSLSQLVVDTPLAYAFLARGIYEERLPSYKQLLGSRESVYQHGTVLVHFFSWGNEHERERFYAHPLYQRAAAFSNTVSTSRAFLLEPC